jgi:hypothetical protein
MRLVFGYFIILFYYCAIIHYILFMFLKILDNEILSY